MSRSRPADNDPFESPRSDRREFIRSTLLTASMLAVAPQALLRGRTWGSGACDPTTTDLYGLGPFFKEGAPIRQIIAAADEPGERIFIGGIVYANDCVTPLRNVVIDIWHADDDGRYSSLSAPDDYRLRAKLVTNAIGAFSFESVKPGFYLNGQQYRPSHVHIKVQQPNGKEFITQLYFEGDPYIADDLAASHSSAINRIIALTPRSDGLHGDFDIILDVPPPVSDTGTGTIHLERALLRQNHPNPVAVSTTIPFYLAERMRVEIAVFDLTGRRARILLNGARDEGMHTIVFDGRDDHGRRLPPGVYTYRMKAGAEAQTMKMVIE